MSQCRESMIPSVFGASNYYFDSENISVIPRESSEKNCYTSR